MFKFRLPIGDWSNDGHGKCDYFTVESNKTVEEVREAHFKARAEIFDIEGFLSEYAENSVDDEAYDELPDFVKKYLEPCDDVHYAMPEGMVRIWMDLLTMADPDLQLTLIEDIPMLPFYGSDDEGRHIGLVGYGVFD